MVHRRVAFMLLQTCMCLLPAPLPALPCACDAALARIPPPEVSVRTCNSQPHSTASTPFPQDTEPVAHSGSQRRHCMAAGHRLQQPCLPVSVLRADEDSSRCIILLHRLSFAAIMENTQRRLAKFQSHLLPHPPSTSSSIARAAGSDSPSIWQEVSQVHGMCLHEIHAGYDPSPPSYLLRTCMMQRLPSRVCTVTRCSPSTRCHFADERLNSCRRLQMQSWVSQKPSRRTLIHRS